MEQQEEAPELYTMNQRDGETREEYHKRVKEERQIFEDALAGRDFNTVIKLVPKFLCYGKYPVGLSGYITGILGTPKTLIDICQGDSVKLKLLVEKIRKNLHYSHYHVKLTIGLVNQLVNDRDFIGAKKQIDECKTVLGYQIGVYTDFHDCENRVNELILLQNMIKKESDSFVHKAQARFIEIIAIFTALIGILFSNITLLSKMDFSDVIKIIPLINLLFLVFLFSISLIFLNWSDESSGNKKKICFLLISLIASLALIILNIISL